jgi:hypothetical protein
MTIETLMQEFESKALLFVPTGYNEFAKADKVRWNDQIYYLDSDLNNSFIIFIYGYEFGLKCKLK